LSALNADEAQVPCWTFRLNPSLGHKPTSNPHAVVSAQSLLWPGAITVAKKKEFANIYIGYGQKYLGRNYTPPPPPPVQTEFVPTFNPEEESDPLLEQVDPLPPQNAPEEKEEDRDSGDEGDDDHPRKKDEEEED